MKTMRTLLYLSAVGLCLAATLTACHDEEVKPNNGGQSSDSSNLGSDANKPHWAIKPCSEESTLSWVVQDSSRNILSTMNVVGKVPESLLSEGIAPTSDSVAVFAGRECVGVASPKSYHAGSWLYMVKVYEPYESGHPLTLAYRVARTGATYYWHDLLTYRTDAVVGSVSQPFLPDMAEAQTYPFSRAVQLTLPASVVDGMRNGDELALLTAQDECRAVLPVKSPTQGRVMLRGGIEKLYVAYYSSASKHVYKSSLFTVEPFGEVLTLSDISLH